MPLPKFIMPDTSSIMPEMKQRRMAYSDPPLLLYWYVMRAIMAVGPMFISMVDPSRKYTKHGMKAE